MWKVAYCLNLQLSLMKPEGRRPLYGGITLGGPPTVKSLKYGSSLMYETSLKDSLSLGDSLWTDAIDCHQFQRGVGAEAFFRIIRGLEQHLP